MGILDLVLSFGPPMGLGVALIAMGYGLVALVRGEEKSEEKITGRLQEHAQEDKRLLHVQVLDGLEERALPAHPYREREGTWTPADVDVEMKRLEARICVIEEEQKNQPAACIPDGGAVEGHRYSQVGQYSDRIALCSRCGGTVKW